MVGTLIKQLCRTTDLDLFIGGHCTKDDLGEALCWEHAEADTANDVVVFDEGQTLVFTRTNGNNVKHL